MYLFSRKVPFRVCNRWTSVGRHPALSSPPSTPNTVSIPYRALTPMSCDAYPTPMQCNCAIALLCHTTCMKSFTWTPYTVHYTVYQGHSYLMHTKVHTFTNVNIHAVILTFITFVSTHRTSMHQHLSDHYLGKQCHTSYL